VDPENRARSIHSEAKWRRKREEEDVAEEAVLQQVLAASVEDAACYHPL
jgi:hypothetical protein